MANKKQHTKARQQSQKKTNRLLIGAAALLCLAVIATLLLRNGQSSSGTEQDSQPVQTISVGESLVIPADEVTATARFYPIEVDGTQMEVIAVRDSEGNIRTAFNTCQICYSSGRGYYVQEGDVLVCQNCKNRFTIDQVEIESGGCNPWPIFSENKTVTEDSISISYDFLSQATRIFANWKVNY